MDYQYFRVHLQIAFWNAYVNTLLSVENNNVPPQPIPLDAQPILAHLNSLEMQRDLLAAPVAAPKPVRRYVHIAPRPPPVAPAPEISFIPISPNTRAVAASAQAPAPVLAQIAVVVAPAPVMTNIQKQKQNPIPALGKVAQGGVQKKKEIMQDKHKNKARPQEKCIQAIQELIILMNFPADEIDNFIEYFKKTYKEGTFQYNFENFKNILTCDKWNHYISAEISNTLTIIQTHVCNTFFRHFRNGSPMFNFRGSEQYCDNKFKCKAGRYRSWVAYLELLLAKHLLINGISPNIKYVELRMLINNFLDSQLSEIAFAHLSTFREVINDFKKFLSLVQLDVLPEIAIIYPLTA